MKKIILASASPRRKELLEQIGIPFESIESKTDENLLEYNSPYEGVKELAYDKAKTVAKIVKGPAIIIGADTMVAFKGRLLGKPENDQLAFENLKRLQGNKHTVYTAICIIVKDEEGASRDYYVVEDTDVYMRKMEDDEIKAYLKTNEHKDKAGGYAIQGKGAMLIEKIDGDYNNVVGLPLTSLCVLLKKIGVDITEYWDR
jgi:septum formation protein